MKKSVLVTRGRTGSSAIIDQLDSAKYIISTQELFTDDKAPEMEYFQHVPPFTNWNLGRLISGFSDERAAARFYLKAHEFKSFIKKSDAFIFKALSVHFAQRPYLEDLLKERNYSVIYLTRNPVQQVLSGLVASKRGIYNTKHNYTKSEKFEIDIPHFRWLVNFEFQKAQEELNYFKSRFDLLHIEYENYLNDPASLFASIFDFLSISNRLTTPSGFRVMIDNYESVISNFSDVKNESICLGFDLFPNKVKA